MSAKKMSIAGKYAEERIKEYEEAEIGMTKKTMKLEQDNEEIGKPLED